MKPVCGNVGRHTTDNRGNKLTNTIQVRFVAGAQTRQGPQTPQTASLGATGTFDSLFFQQSDTCVDPKAAARPFDLASDEIIDVIVEGASPATVEPVPAPEKKAGIASADRPDDPTVQENLSSTRTDSTDQRADTANRQATFVLANPNSPEVQRTNPFTLAEIAPAPVKPLHESTSTPGPDNPIPAVAPGNPQTSDSNGPSSAGSTSPKTEAALPATTPPNALSWRPPYPTDRHPNLLARDTDVHGTAPKQPGLDRIDTVSGHFLPGPATDQPSSRTHAASTETVAIAGITPNRRPALSDPNKLNHSTPAGELGDANTSTAVTRPRPEQHRVVLRPQPGHLHRQTVDMASSVVRHDVAGRTEPASAGNILDLAISEYSTSGINAADTDKHRTPAAAKPVLAPGLATDSRLEGHALPARQPQPLPLVPVSPGTPHRHSPEAVPNSPISTNTREIAGQLLAPNPGPTRVNGQPLAATVVQSEAALSRPRFGDRFADTPQPGPASEARTPVSPTGGNATSNGGSGPVPGPTSEVRFAAIARTPDTSIPAETLTGIQAPPVPPFPHDMPASPQMPNLHLAVRADMARGMADFLTRHTDRQVEITLNPEELGRVRMALQTTETGVIVTIAAERTETLDLMRRHIDQLAAELRQLGYFSIGFAFSERGSRDTAKPKSRTEPPAETAPLLPEPTTLPTRSGISPVGLDLRL